MEKPLKKPMSDNSEGKTIVLAYENHTPVLVQFCYALDEFMLYTLLRSE